MATINLAGVFGGIAAKTESLIYIGTELCAVIKDMGFDEQLGTNVWLVSCGVGYKLAVRDVVNKAYSFLTDEDLNDIAKCDERGEKFNPFRSPHQYVWSAMARDVILNSYSNSNWNNSWTSTTTYVTTSTT